MFRMKAMRYYRLWIYTCNCVLLVSVLLFVVVGSYIFGDARMTLITDVRYYHPTFLYAYIAIVLQGGIIQVIGCIGAVRLNERLLNVYWMVLLVLLLGDLIVGIVWIFRFQRLCAQLPSQLGLRLSQQYGEEPGFTAVWDLVQGADRCCGVLSPADYNTSVWLERHGTLDPTVLPDSCCSGRPALLHLPAAPSTPAALVTPRVQAYRRNRKGHRPRGPSPRPVTTTPEPPAYNGSCVSVHWQRPWGRGCLAPLLRWYKQSADLLFVLGYCVIAFLKLCFLGLLRCEIREMIQKIQVLRCESENADGDDQSELGNSPTVGAAYIAANHVTKDNNNGGGDGGRGGEDGGGGGSLGGGVGGGGSTAGSAADTPIRQLLLRDEGNTTDSETNSHCPLLGRVDRRRNGNNNKLSANRNETHELNELRPRVQTDI